MTATKEFRIYVACLASYNNGDLHGVWIDLEGKDKDAIYAEINAMLRESKYPNVEIGCPSCGGEHPVCERLDCGKCQGKGVVPSAEEWAIHDYEGFTHLDENPDLETVIREVQMQEKHGEAWKAYVNWIGEEYATEDGFEEAYCGECTSPADYAEQYYAEMGVLKDVPESLKYHIDWESVAREMSMGDYYFDDDGYVFRSC